MELREWPSFDLYEIALLNASRTLRHPHLKQAVVETVPGRRKVVRRQGGAGAVYRMEGEAGDVWALKLFRRSLDHGVERFAAISRFLEERGHEPYFVHFRYDVEGIFVRGEWLPVLIMQWCPGLPLDAHIERVVANGHLVDNQALAREWITLRAFLRRLGVVHGDLQHGNILVDDSLRFRLVDYDGVIVPRLQIDGMLATERGHEDYQHPLRLTMVAEPDLALFRAFEDFSSLVVLTSLMVMDAPFWRRFGGLGGLLLGRQDLDDPDLSEAVEAIGATTSGAPLVEKLRRALDDVERSGPLFVEAAAALGVDMPPWNGTRKRSPAAQSASRSRTTGGRRKGPVGGRQLPPPAVVASAGGDEAKPAGGPLSAVDTERLVSALAAGRSDSAIANQLGITPGRVRAEVLRLQRELRVSVRQELAAAYRRQAGEPTGAAVPSQAGTPPTKQPRPAAASEVGADPGASRITQAQDPPVKKAAPAAKVPAPAKKVHASALKAAEAAAKVPAPAKKVPAPAKKVPATAKKAPETAAKIPAPAKKAPAPADKVPTPAKKVPAPAKTASVRAKKVSPPSELQPTGTGARAGPPAVPPPPPRKTGPVFPTELPAVPGTPAARIGAPPVAPGGPPSSIGTPSAPTRRVADASKLDGEDLAKIALIIAVVIGVLLVVLAL